MRVLIALLGLGAALSCNAQGVIWPAATAPCNGTLQACVDAQPAHFMIEIASNNPVSIGGNGSGGDLYLPRSITLVAASGYHPSFPSGVGIQSVMGSATNIVLQGIRLRNGGVTLHSVTAEAISVDVRRMDITPNDASVLQAAYELFVPMVPVLSALVRRQVGNVPLDLVELLDIDQRLLGNLALVVGMQVEEFPARMGHAAGFGHAVSDQRLVARVIVADERTAPVAEEFPGMFARPAVGKVIDHRLDRLEGPNAVRPQVGPMGLAGAGVKHRHLRFVSMQYRVGEHLDFQGIDQRLQGNAHLAHPLGQRRLGNRPAGPAKDAFLTIQRQMIQIFGDQHMGEQAGGRNAFVDHMGRHRRMYQGFALGTGPFAADVAFDRKGARRVVQFLGDVFADALHLATTGASGRFRLVVNLGTRQFRRQRLAFGLALGFRFRKLRQLFGDRRHVRRQGFLEQLSLFNRQAFRVDAEVMALTVRHFMRQFVDLYLTPVELTVLLDEQTAQFVGAELIKVGGQCDGRHDAARKPN